MQSFNAYNSSNLKATILKITSEDIPSITHSPSIRKNSESPIIKRKYTQENADLNQIQPIRIKSSNEGLERLKQLNFKKTLENYQNTEMITNKEACTANKITTNFNYANPISCITPSKNKSSFYKQHFEEQDQHEEKINSENLLCDQYFESNYFLKENAYSSIGFKSSEESLCYQMFLKDMIYSIKYKKNIPPREINQYMAKKIQLPYSNKNFTIVLDLDETLAHLPRSDDEEVGSTKLSFDPDNKDDLTSINIRPYTKEFLTAISQFAEVILFTAGLKPYVDVIVNYLDPERKLFNYIVYRENCIIIPGIKPMIKDIRIFDNRNIENMFIVDNSIFNFCFSPNNGIPALPFYKDVNDNFLPKLYFYLKKLSFEKNKLELNTKEFKINEVFNCGIEQFYKFYFEIYIKDYHKQNENNKLNPDNDHNNSKLFIATPILSKETQDDLINILKEAKQKII